MFVKSPFALLLLIFICVLPVLGQAPGSEMPPSALISPVQTSTLPGGQSAENGISHSLVRTSPLHWDGRGNLYVFTSVRYPFLTSGLDIFRLNDPLLSLYPVRINAAPGRPINGGLWLAATYRDQEGVLYGWYHYEPVRPCANAQLTAPKIGALISRDEGKTWQDLGFVLEAPANALNCESQNYYLAGGEGDFTVIPDQIGQYLYFFFSSYHRQVNEQGIAVARISLADRNQPVGKVWKWYNGLWRGPGLGGRVTPIFPAATDWHRADANALWGPSVHYNSYLRSFVMVLSHATNKFATQEGVYISYNRNPALPLGWSTPLRLPFEPLGRAYPQIIGTAFGETDKLVGQHARLFLAGESTWKISFQLPTAGSVGFGPPPRRTAPAARRTVGLQRLR